LEDKATQLMYLAKGRKGDTTFEECFNVCNWVFFKSLFSLFNLIN
jgi:hypothetical protein